LARANGQPISFPSKRIRATRLTGREDRLVALANGQVVAID
jgi:hypothetical protein